MDHFEKKYGFKEDEKIKEFHKSRRMFCIYKKELHIARKRVSYSHAVWFEKQGWITKDNDTLMNNITRGIVDAKGNIYFYKGYNFKINGVIENEFFRYLKILVKKLKLNVNSKIFGGMIKRNSATLWDPKISYGKIKDYL